MDAKRTSYRRRRREEEGKEREAKTTRQKKDVMNECSWMVSLVVLEVSPGGPPDVPSGTPRKRPKWAPGPAGARNRQILNRTSIEKYTDFDGRRIREFCPSRTRPDLVLFRVLGGTDFRVGFLGVFVSRIRFVEDTSKRMCPLNRPLDASHE